MMNETKNQVSLNNGNTFMAVADLTDEQIAMVLADIDASASIDRVADALNATSGAGDNDREWLEAFLAELGENWIIG